MRALSGLSLVFLVACSNACPPPVLCSEPHPDYCPCNIAAVDAASPPVDAFVEPADAASSGDAGSDAAAMDVGAAASDTGVGSDASTSDAGDDAGFDAHHP